MAFDTLQRWHETHHVDAGAYHIQLPPIRPGIPRYSPWPAVAQSLDRLLPQLDPLNIAKRKLAMAQIPLEQAKTQMALQYGIPMQQAQYQAMMNAYQNGGINPATGKPWTQEDLLHRNKLMQKQDYDSRLDRYLHWQDNAAPTSPQGSTDDDSMNTYAGSDQGQGGTVPDLSDYQEAA